MIRYIASVFLLTFVAFCVAVLPSSDAVAREKGANIYDHRTGKWVKKLKVYRRHGPATKFKRRNVSISTNEKAGTIIVDTKTKYLYLITGKNTDFIQKFTLLSFCIVKRDCRNFLANNSPE